MRFESIFKNGMGAFGADGDEEERRRGKRAPRVDMDAGGDDYSPKGQIKAVNKSSIAPRHPPSKRKRVSDTNDRTLKRTKVITGGSSAESNARSSSNGRSGKEDDAMKQDFQGEESLEVEQNLFDSLDEESLVIIP